MLVSSRFARRAMIGGGVMASFFNKGTNGRWRDVLSAEEVARCDEVAAANLTPDCAHWLKTGELRADRGRGDDTFDGRAR